MFPANMFYDAQMMGAAGPFSVTPNVSLLSQPLPAITAQAPFVDQTILAPDLTPIVSVNIVEYKPSVPPWLQRNATHIPSQQVLLQNPATPVIETALGRNPVHIQWLPQYYQSTENVEMNMAYLPLQHGPKVEPCVTLQRSNSHQSKFNAHSYPIYPENTWNTDFGRFAANSKINDGIFSPQTSLHRTEVNSALPSLSRGGRQVNKIPIDLVTNRRSSSYGTIQQNNEPMRQQTTQICDFAKNQQESLESGVSKITAKKMISIRPLQNVPKNIDTNELTKTVSWKAGLPPLVPTSCFSGRGSFNNAYFVTTQNEPSKPVLKSYHRVPPWLSKNLNCNIVNAKNADNLEDLNKSYTMDAGIKRKLASTDINERPTCKVEPSEKSNPKKQPLINEIPPEWYLTGKSAEKNTVEKDESIQQTLTCNKTLENDVCDTKNATKLPNDGNEKPHENNSEIKFNKLMENTNVITKPIEKLNSAEDAVKALSKGNTDKARGMGDATSVASADEKEKISKIILNKTKNMGSVKGMFITKKNLNTDEKFTVFQVTEGQKQLNSCNNHNLNDNRFKNTVLTHVIGGILIRESKVPFKIEDCTKPDEENRKKIKLAVKCNNKSVLLKNNFSNTKNLSTLTHVIDGLVIQESDQPFRIIKPRWLSTESKTSETKTLGENEDKKYLENSLLSHTGEQSKKTKEPAQVDETLSKHQVMFEKSSETFTSVKSIYLNEAKISTPLNNIPFVDLATLESWSCLELQRHLRQRWCDCMVNLLHDEVDGRALILACAEQLEEIGVCEQHARALCAFAEGSATLM